MNLSAEGQDMAFERFYHADSQTLCHSEVRRHNTSEVEDRAGWQAEMRENTVPAHSNNVHELSGLNVRSTHE